MTKSFFFEKTTHPRVVAESGPQGARVKIFGKPVQLELGIFVKRVGVKERFCRDLITPGTEPWMVDLVLRPRYQILTCAEVTVVSTNY